MSSVQGFDSLVLFLVGGFVTASTWNLQKAPGSPLRLSNIRDTHPSDGSHIYLQARAQILASALNERGGERRIEALEHLTRHPACLGRWHVMRALVCA